MSPAETLTLAKRLLPLDPRQAAALAQAAGDGLAARLLLAAASRRAGDVAQALAVTRALIRHASTPWGIWFEHGMTLSAAGKTHDALAALRRAKALNPSATLVTHAIWDLAATVDAAGKSHERPKLAALTHRGLVADTCAFLNGDALARERLATRWGMDPNDAAAACLIAEIGTVRGFPTAVAHLLRGTLELAPGHRPARFRLADMLHRLGDDAEALAVLTPLLAQVTNASAVLALHGSVLMALGDAEAAAEALKKAHGLAPQDAGVLLSYGHALRAAGRRVEAIAAYRAAITYSLDSGEAYWSLADLKSGALDERDVTAMEALLASGIPPEPASDLHFALGHAHEDAGRYAEAFTHYDIGNRQRHTLEPFDIAAHEAFVARTIATCDAAFFACRKGSGDPSPAPVFVLGMPRAGSSLVEQILASHSSVEGASELPDLTTVARDLSRGLPYHEVLADLPAEAFADAGCAYLKRAKQRRRGTQRHFIDKFPGNVLHLPLIHLALRNARIIDVRRNPLDCCVSLYAQRFARGQAYSYDLRDLARYYAAYVRLTAHIDAVLPRRVLRVRYEDLVDDLEAQTRRMLAHVGLPFEPACLRFHERIDAVRTASSEQVRRPLYTSSVGRWRRFAPWLAPLTEALREANVIEDVAGR
jgi:tetratricopeptide (TPR) repeat protein